jgi:hypothetical protein
MRTFLEKVRLAPWLYKQPLTRVPRDINAAVSDLFIWRNNSEWKSRFDLINLSALINADLSHNEANPGVEIRVMDKEGQLLGTSIVPLGGGYNKVINIADLISGHQDEYGTFCVIHPFIPAVVSEAGSFLAERGYASFQYRQSRLWSYMHGNLDAVAAYPGGTLELLGGSSILRRRYNLQHQITNASSYDIGLTNPSGRRRKLLLKLLDEDGTEHYTAALELPPGGCEITRLPELEMPVRLVVTSKLVMARPIVFRMKGGLLDVFHG